MVAYSFLAGFRQVAGYLQNDSMPDWVAWLAGWLAAGARIGRLCWLTAGGWHTAINEQ
jgi:hypothetical protein